MGSCRGIHHHIFDNPPQPPPPPPPQDSFSSLIESLSSPWNNNSLTKTDIFSELQFKEIDSNRTHHQAQVDDKCTNLGACTEGLGFESLDNLEDQDLCFDFDIDFHKCVTEIWPKKEERNCKGKGKEIKGSFPPPISSIAEHSSNNKVGIFFESHREDGRLILNEIRIPTQDRLLASREDGRLRLCFLDKQRHVFNGGDDEEEDEQQRGDHEDNDDEEVTSEEGGVD